MGCRNHDYDSEGNEVTLISHAFSHHVFPIIGIVLYSPGIGGEAVLRVRGHFVTISRVINCEKR